MLMRVLSRLRCRGRHNVVAVGVGIESPCGALDVYVHTSAHTPTSCHRVVVMIPDCLYQSHRVSTDPFAFLYPDHHLQSMHCTTPLHPLHIIYIHLLSVFYLSTNGHITFYLSIHGLSPLVRFSQSFPSLRSAFLLRTYPAYSHARSAFFLHCNGSFGVVNLI